MADDVFSRFMRSHVSSRLLPPSISIGIESSTYTTTNERTIHYHGLKLLPTGMTESDLFHSFTRNSTLQTMSQASLAITSAAYTRSNGDKLHYNGLKLLQHGMPEAATCHDASSCNSKRRKCGAASASNTAPVSYNNFGPPTKTCSFCNATMWCQERNSKSSSTNPTFSICCQEGKVHLDRLKEPPLPLQQLLEYNDDPKTIQFRQKIRVYNGIFSFTSFGGRVDNSINQSRGPYTFRISGQNYHRFGSLLPAPGTLPRFAQLYFHDTHNEVINRIATVNQGKEELDEKIVKKLIDMLDVNSCVAKAFRMARDWSTQNKSLDFNIRLLGERQIERRQYNTPSVSEIAALVIGDFGKANASRDIIVNSRTSGLQRISELHPLYMALQYPLLFPYGEDGFHTNIPYQNNTGRRKTDRKFVTMREYYCYRIQQRRDEGTALLKGGRLYQQYLVDAYSAIEEQRLSWIKFNQDEIRADLYQNICDAVTKGDTDATSVGKRIVLPSSFTGGPRYMVQQFHDALALCRALGNPTVFITFTANSKWPEITEMLSAIKGQNSADRPDITTRVFKMKLGELMTDIKKNAIFGTHEAAIYTIEFQKRGLPHAHILIWLADESKCKTTDDIDDIISAELPCKETGPVGYKAVTDYMLHGPCGDANKKDPCMNDGKCNKHYPKKFYAETTIDEDGFPVYRRRNNGMHAIKGKNKFDNRHVVPYNRYLLVKYQAHINVEWCNKTRAIKYLFKYVTKGPDRATAAIQENDLGNNRTSNVVQIDEIRQYLDCRYLSSCEAVWRIYSFDISYCKPTIIRLSFHLPDQNTVTVRDSETLPCLLNKEGIKKTMFTEWFRLNAVDAEARQLTYAQIPQRYVWQNKDKFWKARKQRKCIGRITYCHPAAGERYYLRILLNVIKGPTSFQDIRTVNGKVLNSFKETCYVLGMINDDREWTEAMSEATSWASAAQLRQLFVTLLLFCEVLRPCQLWEQHWEALSEDVLYKKRKRYNFPDLQLSEHQIKNYCLLHIEEILNRNGKSLADYPDLPTPDRSLLTKMDNRLIQEEMSYNVRELINEHEWMHESLNSDQLSAYHKVVTAVQKQEGGFYFVYGPGGTGKTFLYKTIIARLRSEEQIVLAVSSSGIASLLLPGGRTAHSRFVIPIELMENSTCNIKQNTHLVELINEASLIIWDEAPMTQRYAFEALDRTLRDIRGNKEQANRNKLFGGITILLGGDFRQILLVIPKGKRQDIVEACINSSNLWENCIVLQLSHNMRVNALDENGNVDQQKQAFNKWLLEVGDGNVQAKVKEDEIEATWIQIPEKFIIKPGKSPVQQVVNETFPDIMLKHRDEDYLRESAILTPLNEHADAVNEYIFRQLHGMIKTYRSSDEICQASTDMADQGLMYPPEYLNTLHFPGMPPHSLNLKEGLPVMLLRNVNPSQGLCNGTRLIITHLGQWVVEAKIITGNNVGERVLIPRITLTSPQSTWPFVMKRRQFPIKPCYAMTINKSQGQSLNYVALYLPAPVFSHGQFYVAISRVTSPDGLKIMMLDNSEELPNHTRNIVYKEVFNNLTSRI